MKYSTDMPLSLARRQNIAMLTDLGNQLEMEAYESHKTTNGRRIYTPALLEKLHQPMAMLVNKACDFQPLEPGFIADANFIEDGIAAMFERMGWISFDSAVDVGLVDSHGIRHTFNAVTSGWMLVSGFEPLTDRIEEVAEWAKLNGPLLPAEDRTVRLMIEAQIARGMDEGVAE